MKNTMKSLKILFLSCLALGGMVACEDDTDFEFIAAPDAEGVNFSGTFANEYLLSQETASNVAERFVWSPVDLGVPTPASYQLFGSISETFDEPAEDLYDSGVINITNQAVLVSDLLAMAERMELEAEETGTVYFRVKAFAGDGQSASTDTFSPTQALTIRKIEAVAPGGGGREIASWGIVGSAANDWGGAGPDITFYTTDDPNIIVAYANLKDGEFKVRENNEWGGDLGDANADGILDADPDNNIPVTAGDYKMTIDLSDMSYTLEPFSWGIVGSAWNDWGGAGPDAKLFYDYVTDTFKVGVRLMDGEMKIRKNNTWDADFGDTGADGTLDAGGDNIVVSEGHYVLTVNFNDNTYTLETAELYGVVGSGYNDWGNDGPDFTFTPLSNGQWIAENVTLVDGEIKFRVNNAWDSDFGDTGADGTLDAGGDNIAVSAGVYDIRLDLSDATAPTYTLITK
ncbi:SusE domain-containing protein [Maribacter sp. 2307ULW6-5]|uniref:SusE domain-containing protein n=1 Tax=Maribacter sp. 2307ULW6-5 TaxID=3386275 RepID=UPI0039BC47F2